MGPMVDSELAKMYAGRKVFVTGHTGFKGTWLTCLLREMGAEVAGYALAPETDPSHFSLLKLAGDIQHVEADVRDRARLAEVLQNFEPEYVFHLAAQPLVRRSYAEPVETIETNVMGSVNLMEAVRGCPSVRSLVMITSDKCYENFEWVWGYREQDPMGGHDPYSASKGAAEVVFSAYYRSYFAHEKKLGAASARAGNVIGGGDWSADRIVPDCVKAIQGDLPISLRNPVATRPWQHVLEPLSGYLLLAAKLRQDPKRFSGSWNFGPNSQEVRTVHEVAKRIVERFGRGKIELGEADARQHEAGLLQLNCDKAHQLLGWQPRWPVEQTIDATADWYREVLEGGIEAALATNRQIKEYYPKLK